MSRALYHYFGYSDFRPGQKAAIEHALTDHDTLVVMPTGSGKSVVFQLAALLRPGTTLVISPPKALMKDQVDSLVRRNISATYIDSTLSPSEVYLRLRGIHDGKYKLVYVAPERIQSPSFRNAIKDVQIGMLAVDEAHCVSQWGHDFRPDYLRVTEIRRQIGSPLTLALTATATPQVQDDIVRLLGLRSPERVITGFNRPNISLEVVRIASDSEKRARMCRFVDNAKGAGIIYTGTRAHAEQVANHIRQDTSQEVQHYHAGLDDRTRIKIQDDFLAGRLPIIVATIAFGMGIDRPDVRYVLHYEMSGTLEAYYQEAGRAGRDGEDARALMLYSPQDRNLHEYFIEEESPSEKDLRKVHEYLVREPETTVRNLESATYLKERKVVTIMRVLEDAGALRPGYRISHGSVHAEALPLQEDRFREVTGKIAIRRERRFEQLDKMVQYAEITTCRRRFLLDHFGDTSPTDAARCCDRCDSRTVASIPPLERKSIPFPMAVLPLQLRKFESELLNAVAQIKAEIGITRLAHIFKGSIPKNMTPPPIKAFHGTLSDYSVEDIAARTNALINQGYLQHVVANNVSLVKLTAKGRASLGSELPSRPQGVIANKVVAIESKKASRTFATKETKQHPQSGLSKVPHPTPSKSPPRAPAVDFASEVYQWGESAREDKIPDLVKALTHENGNVRRLAASALGKLRDTSAVDPLLLLLAYERAPQVRQYAIIALGKIRDPRAREMMQRISTNLDEIEYNREAANVALKAFQGGRTSAMIEQIPSPMSLYNLLYSWRKEKARAIGAMAPAVLSDQVLAYIAEAKPQTRQELLRIFADNLPMVNLYGAEILRLVARSQR